MAQRAANPTNIQVKRAGPRYQDAGGGVVDAGTTTAHTYVAQVIIPKVKSHERLEHKEGTTTVIYRTFNFGNVDNVGLLPIDVRMTDVLVGPDGMQFNPLEIKTFPWCTQVPCWSDQ